jgi:hypothetical protein
LVAGALALAAAYYSFLVAAEAGFLLLTGGESAHSFSYSSSILDVSYSKLFLNY